MLAAGRRGGSTVNKLHFIGGEKGGVGKSVVARILAQYCIDRERPFLAFDSDRSHGSLLRFYSEFAVPASVDAYEGLDHVVESALAQPERLVIVDLAAQTFGFLALWMEDSGVLDLDGEVGSPTYWHVMDTGRDSVDLLQRLLDQFGERLPLVVVLNQARGADFSIVESSGVLTRAQEMGARVIAIGRLHDGTMRKIDAGNTSFWAASQRAGANGAALGLLERQRVKSWLNRAYAEIDRLDL